MTFYSILALVLNVIYSTHYKYVRISKLSYNTALIHIWMKWIYNDICLSFDYQGINEVTKSGLEFLLIQRSTEEEYWGYHKFGLPRLQVLGHFEVAYVWMVRISRDKTVYTDVSVELRKRRRRIRRKRCAVSVTFTRKLTYTIRGSQYQKKKRRVVCDFKIN